MEGKTNPLCKHTVQIHTHAQTRLASVKSVCERMLCSLCLSLSHTLAGLLGGK